MTNTTMTFADDIEAVAGEEAIEAIVIGTPGYRDLTGPVPVTLDVLLTWHEARPMLAYDYDRGYGGAECHAIHAWTATRVLLVAEYDGSTRVASVPRHPVVGPVEMI